MANHDDEYVWLHLAPETFGLRALVKKARVEARVRAEEMAVPPDLPDDPKEVWRVGAKIIQEVLRPRAALEDLRAHVAGLLHRGELEARGIQVAPHPGAEPEPVPRHMFSDPYKIDWERSRIKKSGRTYEEIEVRSAQPLPASKSARQPDTPRRNGRPSKDLEISQIINFLFRNSEMVNSIPRKKAYSLIRDEARRRQLNPNLGYSDPVLQRLLFREFGARK